MYLVFISWVSELQNLNVSQVNAHVVYCVCEYYLALLEGAMCLCITSVVLLFTYGIVLIHPDYFGKTSRKNCKGDNTMLCYM